MAGQNMLPYGRQVIDEDDIAAVTAVLRGDFLTTGPAVASFEAALKRELAAPHALSCNSGTAALHLAMMALGIGPGDTVLVPSITFLASANAARYVGAEVVFTDVDPATGLAGVAEFEAALRRSQGRARAIVPVHYAGQCADPAGLAAFAERHGLAIIEDACHAVGTRYMVGNQQYTIGDCTHSTLAAFSFHPVKTIAMGEGGAVTTRDADLASRVARFRSHGMERDPASLDAEFSIGDDGAVNPWTYEMVEPGYNYRASDINCALGESQLKKLAGFTAKRRALAGLYEQLLPPLAPVIRPLERVSGCDAAWHLQVVRIDFGALGLSRAEVMGALRKRGVGTQVHYIPVHRQPYYRDRYGAQALPGADAFYDSCLSLPLFVGMDEADVTRVVEALSATCQPPAV